MDKIPCTECSALILPATAQSTGGLCMPCKKGFRKSIEQSKIEKAKPKVYDPYDELWLSLIKKSSDDGTLKDMTYDERLYYSVSSLESEVYNGGFDQYFSNSSGSNFAFAREGLQVLKALNALRILEEAAHVIFGERSPALNQEDRWKLMYAPTDDLAVVAKRYRAELELDRLDREFCQDSQLLFDQLTEFARQKGLIAPFEFPDQTKL